MAFNYSFRVAVSLAVALLAGVMWTVDVFWGAFCTALLPIALYWQQKLYRHHVRKVLFMLDAIENNDNAIHFSETENTADARLVNRALNRVAHILYNVKSETAQQEKYYELILDCVNTGILVLNDNGAVVIDLLVLHRGPSGQLVPQIVAPEDPERGLAALALTGVRAAGQCQEESGGQQRSRNAFYHAISPRSMFCPQFIIEPAERQ